MDTSKQSSSAKKLSQHQSQYDQFESEKCLDVVCVEELSQKLTAVAVCKECGGEIFLTIIDRRGLASTIKINCQSCKELSTVINSSQHLLRGSDGKDVNLEEINVRLAYGMPIGKGFAPTKILMGMLNLPPPAAKHHLYQKVLNFAFENVGKESMRAAVESTVEENGGSRDTPISLDGSWQKRGHVSLNGVVSAISMENGKLVDLEVLFKYCRCPEKDKNIHLETCIANCSGTMEIVGAKRIFSRSKKLYDVRYSKYLGDGDCKGFLEVVASKPYGEFTIENLECVGHVQKRLGSRLRKLKQSFSKKN